MEEVFPIVVSLEGMIRFDDRECIGAKESKSRTSAGWEMEGQKELSR